MKDVIILAIETSCDETSVAVVKNGREVLSNIVSSQMDIHARFGGVVPEVASRNHVLSISYITEEAIAKAGINTSDITAIAVTYGAGLVGALLVGVSFAKSLSYSLNIPLIKVNHIRGHIAANYIAHKDLQPPFVSLVVSGGHCAIFDQTSYLENKLVGTTQDDAVGEAYDKVARVLGLGYPGGPKIDAAAKNGQPSIEFIKKDVLAGTSNFSFSGLKTAVINYLNSKKQAGEAINVNDVACSFQKEAVNQIVSKTIKAAKNLGRNKIVLAGGVSANSALREEFSKIGKEENIEVYFPPLSLCTDNAAMIASFAYYMFINNAGEADLTLNAQATLPL